MRRRSSSNAVSLFPFLAVLLCAMGALILLLLLLARQVREDAVRTATARKATPVVAPTVPVFLAPEPEPLPESIPTVTIVLPPPPAEPVPDPDEPYRDRLAAARRERDALAARVAALRSAVSDRSGAAARLRVEVAARRFDADADAERLASRRIRLEELAADRARAAAAVAEAKSRLVQASAAAASAEPKVSVMAYDGLTGTPRRPILVECTGTHIRFLPEDVALTPADLDGFLPDYNPLLAGADVLRGYWADRDGPAGGRPYVLLLVRPDGATAYYAARSLLRSLGNDTGYELITADIDLALPVVDPEARRLCRAAADELLRQRSAILADIARGSKSDSGAFKAVASGRFESDPTDSDPTAIGEKWGRRTPNVSEVGGRPYSPRSGGGSDEEVTARPVGGSGFAGQRSTAGELAATANGSYRRAQPSSPENRLPSSENRLPRSANHSPNAEDHSPSSDDRLPSTESFRDAARRIAEESAPSTRDALDRESQSAWPSFDHRSNRTAGKRQRWGDSSPSAIIALERHISAEITPTEIRVGDQPPIPLGENGVGGREFDAVLSAAEREIAAWGRAPRDFYWTPKMTVGVAPGATRHYDRLRVRLDAVGMAASSRIRLTPLPPPFVELQHVPASP